MRRNRLQVCAFVAAAAATLAALSYAAGSWPDLTVLHNFPGAGKTCSIDGNPTAPPDKKASNRLKNRFRLPPSITAMTLTTLLAAAPGSGGASVPASDGRNNTGISVAGYVREVKRGGTSGESCNCKATGKSQVDTHIELVLDPDDNTQEGQRMVVVETTIRSRKLAQAGLLSTNIGNDWSYSQLRAKLLGRWVRFEGWRFYDPDHHLESWAVDPSDSHGGSNWRGTSWEIHPVMGIHRLTGRPYNL
jgi:hypothetical protein